jgi:large subunit ribosomal protein L20
MARVKRGTMAHKRHKKLLKQAAGHQQGRRKIFRLAKESLLHALAYQTRDRKTRKRDMRRLWIVRINAAARANGLSYSTFMAGLTKAQVAVDRKMLAEMAVNDAATFKGLVDVARAAVKDPTASNDPAQ